MKQSDEANDILIHIMVSTLPNRYKHSVSSLQALLHKAFCPYGVLVLSTKHTVRVIAREKLLFKNAIKLCQPARRKKFWCLPQVSGRLCEAKPEAKSPWRCTQCYNDMGGRANLKLTWVREPCQNSSTIKMGLGPSKDRKKICFEIRIRWGTLWYGTWTNSKNFLKLHF